MLTHQQTHKLHTQIVMTMNLTYKARDILFKQSIADIVIYRFTDSTPYDKKIQLPRSLLDDHVSPRILAADVKRTLR